MKDVTWLIPDYEEMPNPYTTDEKVKKLIHQMRTAGFVDLADEVSSLLTDMANGYIFLAVRTLNKLLEADTSEKIPF
jgi:hypothetical protein